MLNTSITSITLEVDLKTLSFSDFEDRIPENSEAVEIINPVTRIGVKLINPNHTKPLTHTLRSIEGGLSLPLCEGTDLFKNTNTNLIARPHRIVFFYGEKRELFAIEIDNTNFNVTVNSLNILIQKVLGDLKLVPLTETEIGKFGDDLEEFIKTNKEPL